MCLDTFATADVYNSTFVACNWLFLAQAHPKKSSRSCGKSKWKPKHAEKSYAQDSGNSIQLKGTGLGFSAAGVGKTSVLHCERSKLNRTFSVFVPPLPTVFTVVSILGCGIATVVYAILVIELSRVPTDENEVQLQLPTCTAMVREAD